MKKKIIYITGNWAKIRSARQILEPLGYEIDNIKIETPEIQADDVTEVAKYSAKWACEKLGKAVLKNDSGLNVYKNQIDNIKKKILIIIRTDFYNWCKIHCKAKILHLQSLIFINATSFL